MPTAGDCERWQHQGGLRDAVPVGGGEARASTRAPSPARLEAAAGPAGPGRASRRRAEPIISTPGSTGVEGAGGTGGHGRASRRGAERSEALASRAAGPSGARNTSGATSINT